MNVTEQQRRRYCRVHRPLFERLFQPRDSSVFSTENSTTTTDCHNWNLTAYARSVARQGRLVTDNELIQRSRKRRRRRVSNLCEEFRQYVDFSTTFSEREERAAIERANADPLRDALVFAATNHRLFTTGGERSVASIYRALWRLIYGGGGDERHDVTCELTEDAEHVANNHTVFHATAYPWRLGRDTVARFAYDSESCQVSKFDDISENEIARKVTPKRNDDDALARMRDYPYDEFFRARFEGRRRRNDWLCDSSVTWNSLSERDVVKLLDYRFDDPRRAWALVLDVMDWSESVRDTLDFYPVGRSVWDTLVFSRTFSQPFFSNRGERSRRRGKPRFVSTRGLTEIGDVCSYVYTLRVFMLTIYLGCSYGGMARAASVNDRVSNRSHRCAFPAKTSGVYHALFHTSVQPHRLFCGVSEKQHSSDDASANTTASTVETSESRAIGWLARFNNLCDNAATRYDLPKSRRIGRACGDDGSD